MQISIHSKLDKLPFFIWVQGWQTFAKTLFHKQTVPKCLEILAKYALGIANMIEELITILLFMKEYMH